ncbi:ABC transporter ATP-binding protein [Clostridiaceae bacterium NSJ-31]|uniref:ABC transporter ATP-binding protein n=1 Tax=Ligaoa zhengdingensis TaxID=2763658 RepID=A0A926DYU3_9FIRM|nr:ABC transporter ATP-binding protein [Ligaoa zhengdingensis]MBC8545715.1 ABC transporter ATP-binding protein [Ligaoa zhengdingensis]
MSEQAITIRDLSKRYGEKRALDHLTLSIPHGMFGLLGRNGAGKTTLMKTISTLLQKQSGSVTVCGVPVERAREVRRMIGYLPQDFAMYGSMTVAEALDYLGLLSGMSRSKRRERVSLLLERVNLTGQARKRVRALSGGMRQRLGIAQALLHDPKVLIVDEPTAGLDPEERVRFRNLLCEVAQEKTVLLSTHIVGDIEATCENIAILDRGRLLFGGTVAELLAEAEGKVYSIELPQRELAGFRKRYEVTTTVAGPRTATVRFVAPEGDPGIGRLESPRVEDAYLLCLSGAQSGERGERA